MGLGPSKFISIFTQIAFRFLHEKCSVCRLRYTINQDQRLKVSSNISILNPALPLVVLCNLSRCAVLGCPGDLLQAWGKPFTFHHCLYYMSFLPFSCISVTNIRPPPFLCFIPFNPSYSHLLFSYSPFSTYCPLTLLSIIFLSTKPNYMAIKVHK